MEMKSRNTIIISIVALAIVLITVTYAYFSARITGLESASTISLTAGTMGIHYTEGNENVSLNNIYPRDEEWVTKTFTITGNNTTMLEMSYLLGINIETNTFPDNYLSYDLIATNSTNGVPIPDILNGQINGTGRLMFGMGVFTNATNDIHNYELKIYFKDNGLNQNDAQGAVFNAKIIIGEDLVKAPVGWKSARAGTILAKVKKSINSLASSNSINTMISDNITEPLTVPGREQSINSSGRFSITSAYTNNYWTYGTGYVDNGDGTYSLTGVNTLKYSDNYVNLRGNYIISLDPSVASSSSNILLNSDNITDLYLVTSANFITRTQKGNIYYQDLTVVPEAEMASTIDDYGTSYYYRGAIENNYVVFAGMCWRIVRVDGAGNTKLVLYNYNPNNVTNPCATSEDGDTNAFARYNNTYQSAFNTNDNKNTYIGYMYSNNPDSNDFNTAHANDNDSTILTFLKGWYDAKLRAYNDMLADVIWCNDKSVADVSYNPSNTSDLLNTGLGTDKTFYKASQRIYPVSNASPSLVCPSAGSDGKLSKFTARDAVNGNAKLYSNNKEYKIGLLTADEIAFAGCAVNDQGNNSFYLYNNSFGESFSSLSPYLFAYNSSMMWGISVVTTYSISNNTVSGYYGVRPAVSLKPTVSIDNGGDGTSSNPFVVAIN